MPIASVKSETWMLCVIRNPAKPALRPLEMLALVCLFLGDALAGLALKMGERQERFLGVGIDVEHARAEGDAENREARASTRTP